MANALKEIKIFASFPEDIFKHSNVIAIVEETIHDLKCYFSSSGLQLELKHWKKNVHLGRGEPRVQDRINRRLVENCDVFLGILWTKFGSPPGTNLEGMSYSSGTEEEFYIAKTLNKELWLFFCHCPIDPWEIDINQFKKIKDFKETLKKEQIEYAEFRTEDDFRHLFKQNISEWLNEKYSIKIEEKEKKPTPLPTKENFAKYDRGF